MLLEVKGKFKKSPGILSFDGRVVELFGFGHNHPSKRFHIDQINLLLKEKQGLTIAYTEGLISFTYTEGCENLDDFIRTIEEASTNPEFVIK